MSMKMSPMLVRIFFFISQCLNKYEQVHLSDNRSLNQERAIKNGSPPNKRDEILLIDPSDRRGSCFSQNQSSFRFAHQFQSFSDNSKRVNTIITNPSCDVFQCFLYFFIFSIIFIKQIETIKGKCTYLFLTNGDKLRKKTKNVCLCERAKWNEI